jgi:transposase-like protein
VAKAKHNAKRKSNAGRPTKYDPKYHAVLIKWMARSGLLDKEIAKELGVVPSTLYLWRLKHPEVADFLRDGKNVPDALVEDSLYRSALGTVETENVNVREVTTSTTDAEGNTVSRTVTTKFKSKSQVPPNMTACIFWLQNRRADRWKDRRGSKDEGDANEYVRPADPKLVAAVAEAGAIPRPPAEAAADPQPDAPVDAAQAPR